MNAAASNLSAASISAAAAWYRHHRHVAGEAPVATSASADTTRAPGVAWRVGNRRRYDVDYAMSLAFQQAKKTAPAVDSQVSLTLHGQLAATVVDQHGTVADVELRLTPERIESGAATMTISLQTLQKEQSAPVIVRYDLD